MESPTDTRVMGNTADARAMEDTGDSVMGETANTRPPPLSPRTSEDPSTGDPIELDYPFFSIPGSQAPGTENTGLFDDALLGWSTVLNGGLDDAYGFDERHAEDIFGALQDTQSELSQQQQLSPVSQGHPKATSLPSFSHTMSGLSAPGIEPGYHESSLSPPSRTYNRQFSLQHSATTTPPQMMTMDSGSHSQCVIACSQIIFSLEKYQVDKLKVLDLILGIVKRVTERLDPLVNEQFGCPNTKCLALFNTIMYQLAEILEAGCTDFLADTSDVQRPFSSELMEAGFYELDFSGLGVGYKDQERFRSQMILEVLQPTETVVTKT
ncbi:MAG: hypothetical protein M1818_003802 [Claussenomyces sp. TS43310]|nr:MAG: hypothetical protein M1818_003802 [Claussenomyces sp. TS43310]